MSAELRPDAIARVVGFNEDLYALDIAGNVWVQWQEQHAYRWVWILIRPCTEPAIRDLYIHLRASDEGIVIRGHLRILTIEGKLLELPQQWIKRARAVHWDEVPINGQTS